MYGNGTIWYQLEESNPMLNLNPLNNKCLLNSSQKNDAYINPISSNSSQKNDPYEVEVGNSIYRREDESTLEKYTELNIKLDCPLGKGIKFAD